MATSGADQAAPTVGTRDPRVVSSTAVEYDGPMATILVGTPPVKYLVHQKILCRSRWFRAALTGDFKESETGTIKLPDDDLATIKIYVHWLYTGGILCTPDIEIPLTQRGNRHEQYMSLFRAYVFGDKIVHPEFMDSLMNAVCHLAETPTGNGRKYPGSQAIKFVYDRIAATEDGLKRMLVDQVGARSSSSSWWPETKTEHHHPQFLLDLAMSLMSSRALAPPLSRAYSIANLANYHTSTKSRTTAGTAPSQVAP